jgi:23S rRNA (cytidine1920-2'-O)/16S rRNA (cytidine1409-2'-O)-methyltransferase
VSISGRPADKASTLVSEAEPVTVTAAPRRFVSRGGEKLDAALDRFGSDVSGCDCLDAGASTGGFTDCLLRRGAARVAAVDVGYGQLAWSLRTDPRVHVLERTNVRDLLPGDLPFAAEVLVADLSFISLRLVLPALTRVATPDAGSVLLVKPQFEAGRSEVDRGGVVRDPDVWHRVLVDVIDACGAEGWCPMGVMASPLTGPAGNVEFLLAASRRGPERLDAADLEGAIEEGRAIGALR